jgi:hypothetical protein
MWLTACPAESEQPETEINYFQNAPFYKILASGHLYNLTPMTG